MSAKVVGTKPLAAAGPPDRRSAADGGRVEPVFETRLANCSADLLAAARLRYEVFVEELGGDGPLVDHAARLEQDRFDPAFDHLLLIDRNNEPDAQVVGLYRLLSAEKAAQVGGFYSEQEYDLTPLHQSGRRLLELGRSCLHPSYRGGMAMFHLWNALADYVAQSQTEILFGVASFLGTDLSAVAQQLSHLHYHHLAPPGLRPRARAYQRLDLVAEDQVDRRAAMVAMPALIKGYLRLGGQIGDGAYIDKAFNTIDICVVMDMAKINLKAASIYQKSERK
ncbi:MAG: GNAT family N-acetyltransferase [Rhodobacteraceae bacterium]|nr:GNAT family N-acetyltransferase [Paracoccaceae bacterium]